MKMSINGGRLNFYATEKELMTAGFSVHDRVLFEFRDGKIFIFLGRNGNRLHKPSGPNYHGSNAMKKIGRFLSTERKKSRVVDYIYDFGKCFIVDATDIIEYRKQEQSELPMPSEHDTTLKADVALLKEKALKQGFILTAFIEPIAQKTEL